MLKPFFTTCITLLTLCGCGQSQSDLTITGWGPDAMKVGTIENRQPNGSMGVWVRTSSPVSPGEVEIYFGNSKPELVIEGNLITFGVTPDQLVNPGKIEIRLTQPSTGQSKPIGTFEIRP